LEEGITKDRVEGKGKDIVPINSTIVVEGLEGLKEVLKLTGGETCSAVIVHS
jgi:hypothetical protein